LLDKKVSTFEEYYKYDKESMKKEIDAFSEYFWNI